MEVSSIQRSFCTLQYYTGTQNGALITEVSTFQRFVIERFHCISHAVQELPPHIVATLETCHVLSCSENIGGPLHVHHIACI